MLHSARRCAATVIFIAALAGAASAGQDDSIVRQRDDEAARHSSTGFSIAFAGDNRAFHPGEPIKLIFTFRKNDVSPYNYEHCQGLGMADAVLDHTDGTVDPQADMWNNGVTREICGILSGVIGGIRGVAPPPIEFSVYLNQALRFDRPGRYRLYVRSRHKIFGNKEGEPRPLLISNILEFDIVERDAAWESRALKAAATVLDSSSDATLRADAARSINYLGTTGAVEEMVRRLDTNDGVSLGGRSDWWRRGLYGARDRQQVVARLAQELDRPDRFISSNVVQDLTLLDLTGRTNARPVDRSEHESLFRVNAVRRLGVLKAAGRLRANLAATFAAAERFGRLNGFEPGFANFPDDVEAAFGTLTPIQQRSFLEQNRNWIMLRNRAFVPMLLRLARSSDGRGPQDVAFRLLYDLDPGGGRRLALEELARRDSVVGISGLTVIPDQELPDLEHVFVESLERARTADEYARAMDRIERFATGRVSLRVRRAYERFAEARSCTLAPAALAYFFRVDPAYARAEIGRVMKAVYRGPECEGSVIAAVAERRMSPVLEQFAIYQVRDSTGRPAVDAAQMLQQHGAARAEPVLWQALEQWHKRWKGRKATLDAHRGSPDGVPWDEMLEFDLTLAIFGGNGWLLDATANARAAALCVTDRCADVLNMVSDRKLGIAAHPSELPGGEPTFLGTGIGFARLRSRDALWRWISIHAEGTTFEWDENPFSFSEERWMPGERRALFEEVRAFLQAHGMALTDLRAPS